MCHEWCVVYQKTGYDADIFHGFVGVHSVMFDSFTHFRMIEEWIRVHPKTLIDAFVPQSYIFQGMTRKSIEVTIFTDVAVLKIHSAESRNKEKARF